MGDEMLKIRLYLLGYKGYKVLNEIIKNYNTTILETVIVGCDKNIKKDYYNEIFEICNNKSINCIHKEGDNMKSDLISFAIGWRWLIDLKRVKDLIILHDSLLPRYRGFNPLVTALINGDKEIGVTALFASEVYDKGDIIYSESTSVDYPIKIYEAIRIITNNYCKIVLRIIDDLVNQRSLQRIKQLESEASYSLWRDEEDYHIDWNSDNKKIKRFIDAVGYPYKGAFSIISNKKIRILEAEEVKDVQISNRTPGKVIYFEKKQPVVVCGKGLIKITRLIKEDNSNFELTKFRTRLL